MSHIVHWFGHVKLPYHLPYCSTVHQYSPPSQQAGTRLMVINKVALGNVKELYKFDMTLNQAPEGHHSTHGVSSRSAHPIESEFEVHFSPSMNMHARMRTYTFDWQTLCYNIVIKCDYVGWTLFHNPIPNTNPNFYLLTQQLNTKIVILFYTNQLSHLQVEYFIVFPSYNAQRMTIVIDILDWINANKWARGWGVSCQVFQWHKEFPSFAWKLGNYFIHHKRR